MEHVVLVGSSEQPLETVLNKYSPNFNPVAVGRNDVEKWYLLEREVVGTYFITVSRSSPKNIRTTGHNIIVSIGGPIRDQAMLIAEGFQKRTGVQLSQAPLHIRKNFEESNILLENMLRMAGIQVP